MALIQFKPYPENLVPPSFMVMPEWLFTKESSTYDMFPDYEEAKTRYILYFLEFNPLAQKNIGQQLIDSMKGSRTKFNEYDCSLEGLGFTKTTIKQAFSDWFQVYAEIFKQAGLKDIMLLVNIQEDCGVKVTLSDGLMDLIDGSYPADIINFHPSNQEQFLRHCRRQLGMEQLASMMNPE